MVRVRFYVGDVEHRNINIHINKSKRIRGNFVVVVLVCNEYSGLFFMLKVCMIVLILCKEL